MAALELIGKILVILIIEILTIIVAQLIAAAWGVLALFLQVLTRPGSALSSLRFLPKVSLLLAAFSSGVPPHCRRFSWCWML